MYHTGIQLPTREIIWTYPVPNRVTIPSSLEYPAIGSIFLLNLHLRHPSPLSPSPAKSLQTPWPQRCPPLPLRPELTLQHHPKITSVNTLPHGNRAQNSGMHSLGSSDPPKCREEPHPGQLGPSQLHGPDMNSATFGNTPATWE